MKRLFFLVLTLVSATCFAQYLPFGSSLLIGSTTATLTNIKAKVNIPLSYTQVNEAIWLAPDQMNFNNLIEFGQPQNGLAWQFENFKKGIYKSGQIQGRGLLVFSSDYDANNKHYVFVDGNFEGGVLIGDVTIYILNLQRSPMGFLKNLIKLDAGLSDGRFINKIVVRSFGRNSNLNFSGSYKLTANELELETPFTIYNAECMAVVENNSVGTVFTKFDSNTLNGTGKYDIKFKTGEIKQKNFIAISVDEEITAYLGLKIGNYTGYKIDVGVLDKLVSQNNPNNNGAISKLAKLTGFDPTRVWLTTKDNKIIDLSGLKDYSFSNLKKQTKFSSILTDSISFETDLKNLNEIVNAQQNQKWFIQNFTCLSGDCEKGIGIAENQYFILKGSFSNYKLIKGSVTLKEGVKAGLKQTLEGQFSPESYGPGSKNVENIIPSLKQGTNTITSITRNEITIEKGDFNLKGELEGNGEKLFYKNGVLTIIQKNLGTGKWVNGSLTGHGFTQGPEINYDGMFENGKPQSNQPDENGFVNCIVCGKKGKLKGEIFNSKAFYIDNNNFGPFCSIKCGEIHYKKVNGVLSGMLEAERKRMLEVIKCNYCANPTKVIRRDLVLGETDRKEYCSQKCACDANVKNCK